MKKISVVVPFYNEEANLPLIYDELREVMDSLKSHYEFEVLFVDNRSTDSSFAVAYELSQKDPRLKCLRQSRNFGYQANILAGMSESTGDAMVQLDADGEDDPKLIVEFLKKWEEGYQVVYGVRRQRAESYLVQIQRKIFYRSIAKLSSVPLPLDAGDFRLLDRCVIDALKNFPEKGLYLRGMIAYAGFSQFGIPYCRRPRWKGESKFSWFDYVALALTGVTSFSAKPLFLVLWLGTLLSILSFLGFVLYLCFWLFGGIPVKGFTTLVLIHLGLSGVNLICLGAIGRYVGAIFDEVKGRPRYILDPSTPKDKSLD